MSSRRSIRNGPYRRLYAPVAMNSTGRRFQEEIQRAIKPVLARWRRRRVDSRDMENVAVHAVQFAMCFIHIERQTPMRRKAKAAARERKGGRA